ncbi:serine protease inhibitor 2.1-like [Pomacea canaliculata]|nr:serine protease inhibitor 2.1-like [Pomacea canaliculata]
MGLRTAFSRRADFRRISLRPLSISKVIHKAIIEVTETGSRAAAVTSVELVLLSLPVQVNVNKPFVFILRDKTSGLNLFMGRVTDPSQE